MLSFGLDPILAHLPWFAYAVIPLIVLAGFAIFGLTGFGSAIVCSPLLAHFFPVRFVVPLQMVLDFFAALALGSRVHARINRGEVGLILPFMLIGVAVGVTLLVNLPERTLFLLLGAFVLGYGLLGLAGRAPRGRIAAWWGAPIAMAGGVVSALFGTGGPIYVIYLSRRISDLAELRATIAAVILIVNVTRVMVFGAAGLLTQPGLLALAAILLPLMAAGLFLGMRLHQRLPTVRVRQAVFALLVASGLSLLARAGVWPAL